MKLSLTGSQFLLRCGDKEINLRNPQVMGILNVTSDSFYDGGSYINAEKAVERGLQIIEEGASILDIGGESTRPGAEPISVQEEIDRIIPVIQSLRKETQAVISVDTNKPDVMSKAISSGADLINDISALQQLNAVEIIAKHKVGICLMHMQGSPVNMQEQPVYEDVITGIKTFLRQRINLCTEWGIAKDRILIDPGFGFGKTTAHNLQILKNLQSFRELGFPILAGLSRKFSIGEILNKPVDQRLYGSIAAHVIAVLNGANIVRVHDVKQTVDALTIVSAVLSQE